MDQISGIWRQKSSICHIFNPLNPPYQGDSKEEVRKYYFNSSHIRQQKTRIHIWIRVFR